jgi:hypothetical protein
MSYIGVIPAEAYASFYVQHFTTSATTSYALDYPVVNENDLRLVINNVVQQPGSSYAYTAAASTLTLSAATTTSDTMYTVFLGRALQTVNPPAGSVGTSQIEANAVTLAKIADGTQGDVLYYGASGAPTLLGFGTSGDFLKTQGTGANPVWASAGGGKIGQVVQTVNTATETLSSTSPTTISDFTVTITPAATTSKILVFTSAMIGQQTNNTTSIQIFRDTTQIFMGDAAGSRSRTSFSAMIHNDRSWGTFSSCYLDSPSSTSALDYSCKWFSQGGVVIYMNRTDDDNDTAAYDNRTASSITVMEVLA